MLTVYIEKSTEISLLLKSSHSQSETRTVNETRPLPTSFLAEIRVLRERMITCKIGDATSSFRIGQKSTTTLHLLASQQTYSPHRFRKTRASHNQLLHFNCTHEIAESSRAHHRVSPRSIWTVNWQPGRCPGFSVCCPSTMSRCER